MNVEQKLALDERVSKHAAVRRLRQQASRPGGAPDEEREPGEVEGGHVRECKRPQADGSCLVLIVDRQLELGGLAALDCGSGCRQRA